MMTCLKITESRNGQIYPEDTFFHGAAQIEKWQLRTSVQCIMLINVEISAIAGIVTYISMIISCSIELSTNSFYNLVTWLTCMLMHNVSLTHSFEFNLDETHLFRLLYIMYVDIIWFLLCMTLHRNVLWLGVTL